MFLLCCIALCEHCCLHSKEDSGPRPPTVCSARCDNRTYSRVTRNVKLFKYTILQTGVCKILSWFRKHHIHLYRAYSLIKEEVFKKKTCLAPQCFPKQQRCLLFALLINISNELTKTNPNLHLDIERSNKTGLKHSEFL